MKIVSIVGTRAQFVNVSALSRAIKKYNNIEHIIVHTGQHFEHNMSDIFFKELDIPHPYFNLEVGFNSIDNQFEYLKGKLLELFSNIKPDLVIVFGDNISSFSGAFTCFNLKIPVVHAEAGVRCFNTTLYEETIRTQIDQYSNFLFAPSSSCMDHLKSEGLDYKALFSGDILYDSILHYSSKISQPKNSLTQGFEPDNFFLATVHYEENIRDINKLQSIFLALSDLDYPIIVPLHPHVIKVVDDIAFRSNVNIIQPVGYLEMLWLMQNCRRVITDSSYLQKEAYFMKKQCITLRNETEWTETLSGNWNILTGSNRIQILDKINEPILEPQVNAFGDGHAAKNIIEYLIRNF
jgi:UDP-GlcNAc3NAcA epimerase